MRITNVICGLGGGGAERVCVNLANAWAVRGQLVTILTVGRHPASPLYEVDPRVELRSLGWPRRPLREELSADAVAPVVRGLRGAGCMKLIEELGLIAALRRAILATAPEAVVSHIDLTNVRVLAAMHETGVPVVACEHTDTTQIWPERWWAERDALYRRASAVVASHPSIAAWLARRGARARSIPNPLSKPTKKGNGRVAGRRRLVTLSRLSPEKRIDLLVRAFASVARDFPEWELEVYGDGPLRASLTRLAAQTAPGRIHFRGFVRGAESAVVGADIFVSSSWVEGFGNAIWEALACGVPVVAMECGAPVRTLVRDGVDGLIVGESNAQALARALASLMGDEAARASLAARAGEVVKRFPIESSLRAWDELLEEVTAQPKGRRTRAGARGTPVQKASVDRWEWPGGAEAAVSLTYDDGVDSGLDHAMPDLERAGFRGSFYLPVGNPQVFDRMADWKRAFLNGHEIGNHTLHHPCRGSSHEHRLEHYSPADIRNEVLDSAKWFDEYIGVDRYRTFAYPCGHVAVGDPPDEDSYASAVRACHFAARLAGPGVAALVNDPLQVSKNPLRIQAAVIGYPNGREVKPFVEYCEKAARAGGWAVVVFHGIGDDWLPTGRDIHQQLIEHLRDARFWVAPVREVASYILRRA
jgi:GalNAc-alpha-(1->4)-GalNAc-alpha-(1->3)-diNAcBac-PP-undecaprenol alpha-1,4-N-acetyl-D-galactosaminyltransferase